MILAINRSHVQKDCVAQTVAGQDLSALHEVFPFVQGRFKASRVLRERLREHDGLWHVMPSTRVGSVVSLYQ